ncbi:hypothetical protein EJ04DRAFT_553345 [Polyplosphaeria fusca]|uniref:Rhodopsin domain-containing protein n=1 Tax=Polyplosphaeria fusca TaxID=682080 RepID=A0A9P4V1P0_9PLEO|nr:hypothetical protein EJ04DRAFT_553345 [Polyplosphaeria fusca]
MDHLLSKRAFDISTRRQLTLVVFPPVLFAVATALVGLRFYARKLKGGSIGLDDVFCLVGLVMGYVFLALVFVMIFLAGEGLPMAVVMADSGVATLWKELTFVLNIFWANAIAAIQISCLLSYSRHYDSFRTAKNICNILIACIAAWWLGTIITWLNTCRPLARVFDSGVAGTCPVNSKLACGLIGCFHAFFDVAVMIAPIAAITTRRHSLTEKVILSALFFLGSLCTLTAVMRIDCLISRVPQNVDASSVSWWNVIRGSSEITLGMWCCCIPTLTPVRDHWLKRWYHPNDGNIRLRRFNSNGTAASGGSELSRIWQGRTGGRVKAFVSVDDSSSERNKDVEENPNQIKVTKEYIVVP